MVKSINQCSHYKCSAKQFASSDLIESGVAMGPTSVIARSDCCVGVTCGRAFRGRNRGNGGRAASASGS